jgi:hypothetical protein
LPGLALLLLTLALPQQAVAPYGWGCLVDEDLGSGVSMGISQAVNTPGLNSFPRIVQVKGLSRQLAGYDQTFQWLMVKPEDALGDPESLSLEIDLKKRDLKGTIRLDHDGGSISLPSMRILSDVSHRKASLLIEDRPALQALSHSTHWRISVLDRHGAVQSSVEGALPRLEDMASAFLRLAPKLAKKVAAPAGQCSELDVGAWI